jgi:predicted metalloprotease
MASITIAPLQTAAGEQIMKWEGNRESDNVEDRRGEDGGGGGGFGFGGRSIGLGTVAVALVASYFLGINPLTMLNLLSGRWRAGAATGAPTSLRPTTRWPASSPPCWPIPKIPGARSSPAMASSYVRPKLVLFSGSTPTACGTGQTATGPFYCPGDQKVYIDLSFYELMKQRFKVSGNLPKAYVIAHEVGPPRAKPHGHLRQGRRRPPQRQRKQANAMSVRLELQADCFAGVWAYPPTRRATSSKKATSKMPECRLGHRRRCPATPGARRGRAGFLHPWQLGAARDLVQARHFRRQGQRLQHLRRQGTLIH